MLVLKWHFLYKCTSLFLSLLLLLFGCCCYYYIFFICLLSFLLLLFIPYLYLNKWVSLMRSQKRLNNFVSTHKWYMFGKSIDILFESTKKSTQNKNKEEEERAEVVTHQFNAISMHVHTRHISIYLL